MFILMKFMSGLAAILATLSRSGFPWAGVAAELLFFAFWKYLVTMPKLLVSPISDQTRRRESL